MKEIQLKILELLESTNDEMFIAEIAEKLGVSKATISKHLDILEAMGKVICRHKKPYKFWRIKK